MFELAFQNQVLHSQNPAEQKNRISLFEFLVWGEVNGMVAIEIGEEDEADGAIGEGMIGIRHLFQLTPTPMLGTKVANTSAEPQLVTKFVFNTLHFGLLLSSKICFQHTVLRSDLLN